MRTTVILEDNVYAQLVKIAVERYGSAKRLSLTLNNILSSVFEKEGVPTDMFGAWKRGKRLSSKGLRDEGEPH